MISPHSTVPTQCANSQCQVLQATRGGRTKLAHLTAPQADYQNEEKGDALHAMELALSLEKLNFHKLRELHDVAEKSDDAQFSDFVEAMLADQVCFALLHCLCQCQQQGLCFGWLLTGHVPCAARKSCAARKWTSDTATAGMVHVCLWHL